VGSGGPVATPEAFGTSLVLKSRNDYLMFDCGPAATDKMVNLGLFPSNINHLFFTHHHSDHDLDYPAFLLTRWFDDSGHLG
jgi:ribonuclease BN (tRNA processing enzyme)